MPTFSTKRQEVTCISLLISVPVHYITIPRATSFTKYPEYISSAEHFSISTSARHYITRFTTLHNQAQQAQKYTKVNQMARSLKMPSLQRTYASSSFLLLLVPALGLVVEVARLLVIGRGLTLHKW
jgi:hypothetical protein